jgi:hypothetical protein
MNTAYLEKIDRSSPTFGALIAARGTFRSSLIIGLGCFFDRDGKDNVDLFYIKNAIQKHRKIIKDKHKALGIPQSDTEQLFKKLAKTCNRINKGFPRKSFDRLEVWRNREYAHIDVSPTRLEVIPSSRDFTICFVPTAKIFRDIHCILLPGSPDMLMSEIRGNIRFQAQQFINSIRPLPPMQRGFGFGVTRDG